MEKLKVYQIYRKLLVISLIMTMVLTYLAPLEKIILASNNITYLDTPTNLSWKDDSTATATWDVVENANYYTIILYLYNDSDELLNIKETGTASNELDVQQEINYMMNEKNIEQKAFNVSFEITALSVYDNETIMSEKSSESPKKQFAIGTGTIKIDTPTNISIDDDYNVTWSAPEGVYLYWLTFSLNGNYDSLYGEPVFLNQTSEYSYGTTTNGVFKANIKKAVSQFYNDMVRTNKIQAGQTVELKFKVQANPNSSENSKYIASDISEFSSSFNFSDSELIKIDTPTNVCIDDDYNVTWSAPEGVYLYWLTFSLNGNYNSLYGEPVFLNQTSEYSYGTTTNGVFKGNIKKAVSHFYNDMVRTNKIEAGQTVELKFRVKANPNSSENSKYIASDISEFSNSFNYSNSELIKIDTPTNISIDDDYNVTWSAPEGVYLYWLTFSLNGNYNSLYGEPVFLNQASEYSYGTTTNGVFKGNIKKAVSHFYNDMVRTNKIEAGQTVELKFRVKANPNSSANSKYIASDISEFSNIFYYNCDGLTKIDSIILSPNSPVIAVGRNLYIGKTINPENALYDKIQWSSSDNSTVYIDNMGKITGLKKGNATITAKINNAMQNAEVSVYEIESNIPNSQQSNQVIDEANDIIEAITCGEDISNVDITNKEFAINEIEQGAKNGNQFKVDVNYDNKKASDYNDIKDIIKDNYDNYEIACGNDVTIEISHIDNDGTQHHITNITELDNYVDIHFELNDDVLNVPRTKERDYKLVRCHDNIIEEIDFDILNGNVITSSNKFSDFILLYKDTDLPTYIISGNIKSFGNRLDNINIQLYSNKDNEMVYEGTVKGNSANYTINNIINGSYTLKLEKNNHTTGIYNIDIEDNNIIVNSTLYLMGDLNKDGKLEDKDIQVLEDYLNDNNKIIEFNLADLNNDQTINESDLILLRELINSIPKYSKGDLDKNGVVDANDASVVLELYKAQNATEEDIEIGDMDNNSLIDANDASLILEYYKTHQ